MMISFLSTDFLSNGCKGLQETLKKLQQQVSKCRVSFLFKSTFWIMMIHILLPDEQTNSLDGVDIQNKFKTIEELEKQFEEHGERPTGFVCLLFWRIFLKIKLQSFLKWRVSWLNIRPESKNTIARYFLWSIIKAFKGFTIVIFSIRQDRAVGNPAKSQEPNFERVLSRLFGQKGKTW